MRLMLRTGREGGVVGDCVRRVSELVGVVEVDAALVAVGLGEAGQRVGDPEVEADVGGGREVDPVVVVVVAAVEDLEQHLPVVLVEEVEQTGVVGAARSHHAVAGCTVVVAPGHFDLEAAVVEAHGVGVRCARFDIGFEQGDRLVEGLDGNARVVDAEATVGLEHQKIPECLDDDRVDTAVDLVRFAGWRHHVDACDRRRSHNRGIGKCDDERLATAGLRELDLSDVEDIGDLGAVDVDRIPRLGLRFEEVVERALESSLELVHLLLNRALEVFRVEAWVAALADVRGCVEGVVGTALVVGEIVGRRRRLHVAGHAGVLDIRRLRVVGDLTAINI